MKYETIGSEFQYLLVDLQPGEEIYVDGSHVIYKDKSVTLNAKMVGGFLSALKREITGTTFFLLEAIGPGKIALSSPLAGKVVKIDLGNRGILVEHTSFLASENTVKYESKLGSLTAGLFGGEGIFLAKLEGKGSVFLHAVGQVNELYLNNQELQVEAAHLLAFEEGLNYGITRVGNLKTMLFGDEGLFFVNLSGTGKVWVKSSSRRDVALSIYKYLPRRQ
ncbi:TIGR00266 family protein [Caldisphaera lagunensis DSM 15908]|uniref:TIGR00266 family protein n=1 Tax=Caldisphaera lagunensis (strain DSM 15908 / JCM 11604 / ANMR 0165 / IC-154) TaxID=1056495 RepID=L0A9L0_CALLD|nr:TIGR00266 family protein [Caldisphaera lagunensis]AFZ70089.1 TIGR00266 family protein [Caldisphaera lagunensis DSM 15908]